MGKEVRVERMCEGDTQDGTNVKKGWRRYKETVGVLHGGRRNETNVKVVRMR